MPVARGTVDIAVIIPTYNRANLLATTLDSVLAQTYRPAEVIVVDDGSTDGTREVVARYSGTVRYHRIENSGVCRARNIAVQLSSTPWIAFCDSDDVWREDKLEAQVELIAAAPHVEYVFSDFAVLNGDEPARIGRTRRIEGVSKFRQAPRGFWEPGRCLVGRDLWVFEDPLYERILRFQPIFMSTILMTRRLFDACGGFDERLGRIRSEDLEFTLRCQQHAPVGAVARPIVSIRKHADNFSGDYLNTVLGEIEILRFARAHHVPFGQQHAAAIEDEIARRTCGAVDQAFAQGCLGLLRELARSKELGRIDSRRRAKLLVAGLPDLLAQPLRGALCLTSQVAAHWRLAVGG